MRQRRITLAAVFTAAALLAAACGDGEATTGADGASPEAAATADAGTTPAEEPTTAEETTEEETADATGTMAAGATVEVADTDLGEVLVDGEGNTLYLFLADEQGESTCYDSCAQNWPALEGEAEAGEGVDEALLGTVERDDGTAQVTYGDWPLYYFAGDSAPGDINGQGVGDVWYVIDPEGQPVNGDATEAATATGAGSGGDDEGDY